ncbi:dTDP-4-amino-4,6-dideoxygalactose transaminase [Paenibacillus endophyticus]|uniref:dTDP-4-amino-4,6-dideoxygalactose transaminase n=1 Tax=Paenibacillus endophyticus TaxID=1294268 RepID=A0A7W5C9G8_9BACL|nr:DegT/DnrJ/EryC1/StrS family aminotransferase [Paenibacillus endophyticus]MBB3153606.1 dTDP-4-amino-4,6-dideoxygalactose transaminase [Paenibacillus endophyticus]
MGILFAGPQLEFEQIREAWFDAAAQLAAKGVFVGGHPVTAFEGAFARYSGTSHAAGVGNGTDALFLALKALGIGPGDEVVTAANTFVATAEAIHHTGATPVLADCDLGSYLIDPESLMEKLTPRTKAVIPVHLYGQMVDMSPWISLVRERGIAVVEDSAQAAGARLGGMPAGSIGNAGCFSFYPDKNLGALGDGGAIVTSDESLLSTVRKLRNHGGETRYTHDIPGYNSRLDALQALALSLKLERLDEWSAHRRRIAGLYERYLGEVDGIVLPAHRGDDSHVFHLYVVRLPVEARESARRYLQKKGILTAVQYPLPVHLLPAFRHLGYKAGDFPIAEFCSERILSLPMHIGMNEEAVLEVAEGLKGALASPAYRS